MKKMILVIFMYVSCVNQVIRVAIGRCEIVCHFDSLVYVTKMFNTTEMKCGDYASFLEVDGPALGNYKICDCEHEFIPK